MILINLQNSLIAVASLPIYWIPYASAGQENPIEQHFWRSFCEDFENCAETETTLWKQYTQLWKEQ